MPDTEFGKQAKTRVFKTLFKGMAILALIVAIGVWAVFYYVADQRTRETQNWQIRLGIIAETRMTQVERWVADQMSAISVLADNASLQIYMTQLAIDANNGDGSIQDIPEADYLINLLNNQAVNSGFWSPEEPEIKANVSRPGRSGIGLTDKTGQLLVASGNMPPMNPAIRLALSQAAEGQSALVDIYEGVSGDPTMGFVKPIYATQQDGETNSIIGFVVGIRTVGKDLYPLLKQPGDLTQSSETYLVRKKDNLVEYLSPLMDGTGPLKRTLASHPTLAASYALQNPGGFIEARDYLGEKVLVTGRPVPGTSWVLVRKIQKREALSDVEQRLSWTLGVMLLIIFGAAGAVIAVWRHGTSVRAEELAENYRLVAERLEERGEFLRVVTDSQPTAIAVFDADDSYSFANRLAANDAGIDQDDMIGKSAANVLGPAHARQITDMTRAVRNEGQPLSRVDRLGDGDIFRIMKSDYIPLHQQETDMKSVLTVMQDITDVVVERERREGVLRSLVATLVAFVDRRDPYSAHQSARVVEVGVAIATEMELEEEEINTIDIVGNLMNLGKILVPPELLTKTGQLSDEEREIIQGSMFSSADLLEDVDFDLPVTDTLRQIQERWDGKGYPNQLAGSQISAAAQIVAVANAFVGMVSPRAYRDAMDFSKAVSILLEDADTKFDRRPISALINYVENRGGREQWKHFAEPPEVVD